MFFACRLKTPFVPRTRTISSALSVITSANTNQTLPQGKKQQKLNPNKPKQRPNDKSTTPNQTNLLFK